MTYLVDEFLELRTFESFPGLRAAQHDFLRMVTQSKTQFVLSTRFEQRGIRWTEAAPERFELIRLGPFVEHEVRRDCGALSGDEPEAGFLTVLVHGNPSYLNAVLSHRMEPSADLLLAFIAALGPNGLLAARVRHSYGFRLHRARGYGALKAILEVLAADDPLSLAAIASSIDRTCGSVKDYLTWLRDVDLVEVTGKRYRMADPVMRLWLQVDRLVQSADYESEVYRLVHMYAFERMRATAEAAELPRHTQEPSSRARPMTETTEVTSPPKTRSLLKDRRRRSSGSHLGATRVR